MRPMSTFFDIQLSNSRGINIDKYNNKSIYDSFQARNVYVLRDASSIIEHKHTVDKTVQM